ncbi:histamine H3 receptor-like [Diadema antillarum]|uniref:histamine H3 receptor-like n=1 Tax=Diadema antillarum TaxID=105358 RepID=UPI003A8576F7
METSNCTAGHCHLAQDVRHLPEVLLVSTVYVVFSIVTVIGNAIVMMSYVRDGVVRKHASNLIIVHLAVTDFLVGAISLPVWFVIYLQGDGERWVWGRLPCQWYLLVDYSCTALSAALVVCVSLDRLWIVTKGARYKTFQTRRRVKVMITGLWLIIGGFYAFMIFAWQAVTGIDINTLDVDEICDIDFAFADYASVLYFAIDGCVPIALIVTFNAATYVCLWDQSRKLLQNGPTRKYDQEKKTKGIYTISCSHGVDEASTLRKRLSASLKMIRRGGRYSKRGQTIRQVRHFRKVRRSAAKLSVIAACFVFCWLPYEVAFTIESFHSPVSSKVWQACTLLQWANSGLNPILYAVTNVRYRRHFKRFLFCKLA